MLSVADRSRTLTVAARDLVTERGLHGCTVQDVADRAGVSRRTFFNHFASKEHAVLGFSLHVPADLGEREFLACASGPVGLLEAFGTLLMTRMGAYVGSLEAFEELQAVLRQEVRLQEGLQALLRHRFQDDVRLVERWMGVAPGEPRAALAVSTVIWLLQRVLQQRLQDGSTGSFQAEFAADLLLLREVVVVRGSSR